MKNIDKVMARVYASLSERDEKMLHPDYDKEPINEYSGVQWGDLRILLNYCEQLEIERNMLHERLSANSGWAENEENNL